MVVQAEGCAPIQRAYERGENLAELWHDAHTRASGIRVPVAIGEHLILGTVRESGGTEVTVSEQQIVDAQLAMGRLAGVYGAPEGEATWAAIRKLRAQGWLDGTGRVVLFNCGAGLKYDPPRQLEAAPA